MKNKKNKNTLHRLFEFAGSCKGLLLSSVAVSYTHLDPLSKDLDNDGIADRYDNDFKDSDYFESTYDCLLYTSRCV